MEYHGARIKRLHPDERKCKANAQDCGHPLRLLSYRGKLRVLMYVTLTILYLAFTMDTNRKILSSAPVLVEVHHTTTEIVPMNDTRVVIYAMGMHQNTTTGIDGTVNYDVRLVGSLATVNTSVSMTLQPRSKNAGNKKMTAKQIYRKTPCNNKKAYVLEYTDISKLMMQMFQGKLLCSDLGRISNTTQKITLPKKCTKPHPIIVNITLSCSDIFYRKLCGTGNMIQLIYAIRVTAKLYGNVDVIITCNDANIAKRELVLPWLMGAFVSTSSVHGNNKRRNKSLRNSTSANVCSAYYYSPLLSYMYKEIIYDFRKMAIHLLGVIRHQNTTIPHPSVSYAESNFYSLQQGSMTSQPEVVFNTGSNPLLPIPKRNDRPLFALNEDKLDAAVIHFRCGDLMNSTHPNYSFMKFSGYARHISPDATSIGIITQPFEKGAQSRDLDSNPALINRCYIVVNALLEYVQERQPNARVRIRNNSTEPITVAFARMIMANQTVIGASSFSVMPAVATFGTGYIRLPTEKSPYGWLIHPRIDQFVSNLVLFEEPNIIKVADLKRMWEEEGEIGVLNWFRNDSLQLTSTTDLPKN